MAAQLRQSPSGLEVTMNAQMIGVGAGDIQQAVAAEVERIVKKTRGSARAQQKLLTAMLHERGLINDNEVTVISKLAEISQEAGAGKKGAKEGYFESRDLYNALLTSGDASPLALVIASSSVGSYEIKQDNGGAGGVVFKKSSGDWEGRGTAIGGLIGAAVGGVAGAAIGGAIGGAVGHAVDKCAD